jgi:hypothetical protein
VQSGAECRGVYQSQGAWFSLVVRRNYPKASNSNSTWAQDPDRVSVSSGGRGDRDIVYAKDVRNLFWRDAVGHQGRDPTVVRNVGIQRTEFDETIEHIVADVAKIHSVRHVPA